MNIVRGTGCKGLCGIPPIRGNIIRPLIMTSRDDIELYCKENSLDFVTDSTNLQNEYKRNVIARLGRREAFGLSQGIAPQDINEVFKRKY